MQVANVSVSRENVAVLNDVLFVIVWFVLSLNILLLFFVVVVLS